MNEVVKTPKFRTRGWYLTQSRMELVGIRREDFDMKGITRTKALARKTFRHKILKVMEDGGDETLMRKLISVHQRVQEVKRPPITIDNVLSVLEVNKGYKSTDDVDLGLNGKTTIGEETGMLSRDEMVQSDG